MSEHKRLSTADRLAIAESFARYGHSYDGGRIDDYMALFASDAHIDLGGHIFDNPQALRTVAERRVQGFADGGIQRRHLFTNIAVEPIEPGRAQAVAYYLITSSDRARGEWRPLTTGLYTAEVCKIGGRWQICRLQAHFDHAPA